MTDARLRLRREPDFARFWTAQAVSLLGSQVTIMALPLTAILTLHSGPLGTGLLFFGQYLPALFFGLHSGAVVDRFGKRTVLVISDAARAMLLAAVVVLAVTHALNMPLLVLLAFFVGTFDTLAMICGQAYVPSLVDEPHLMAANARLQQVSTFAEVAGNGLAGLLVQALTAPVALVVDVASFLFSAVVTATVRRQGAPEPAADGEPEARARDGLAFVFGHPRLRAITLCASTSNFFSSLMVALYLLFATRTLGLSPGLIGVLLTVASCAALVSTGVTGAANKRFGVRGTLVAAQLVMAAGCVILPFAGGPLVVKSVLLMLSHGVFVVGMVAFMITQITYRQQVTPQRMQGRVHAANHVFAYAGYAIGALVGGVLGSTIGLRPALVIGALGHIVAAAWLLPRRAGVGDATPAAEVADVPA